MSRAPPPPQADPSCGRRVPAGRCALVADPWGNPLALVDGRNRRRVREGGGNVTGILGRPIDRVFPQFHP